MRRWNVCSDVLSLRRGLSDRENERIDRASSKSTSGSSKAGVSALCSDVAYRAVRSIVEPDRNVLKLSVEWCDRVKLGVRGRASGLDCFCGRAGICGCCELKRASRYAGLETLLMLGKRFIILIDVYGACDVEMKSFGSKLGPGADFVVSV